ncbi:dentin sialophosphoprotein-like [Diaphorina citri]|uniref:Dentin sialophosphoprotein-like n=1 Tax=Diaphorina citri TaxID=121845 RepID=A0A3Q0J431_DIACI|nr:dentin sialophosphoprotein-like [Diaphorina citri]
MDCENANNDAVADAPPSAENESPDNIVNTDKTSSPVIEPETTPIENVSSESHVNTDQINPPLTNENVSTGDIGSSASNADINPPADIISPSTNENDTSETDINADDGIKTVLETNKDNILPNESIDTNPSTETPEEKPSESISSNTEDKLDSCTIESDKTQNDTDETNSNELGSTKPEDSEVPENVTAVESNISPDVPSCKDLSSENVNNSLPENEDSTNMETHIPPSHLEINSTDPKDAGESVGETKPSYPDSKELSAQVEPTESDITDKTVEHCDTTDVESSIALSEQSTPDEQTLVEASSDQTEPSDIQISTEDNTDNHQQESSTEISAKEKNIDDGMTEKSALVKNTSALVEEKEEESINRPTDIVDSEKTNHVISSEANDLPDTSSDSIEKVTSKSIENENLSQEEIENSVADKPSCPVSVETEKTTEESTPSFSLSDSRISSELTEQSDPNADNNTSLETDEVNVNGGESLTKGGLEDEQSTETLKNDAASPNATSEKDEAMEVVDSVEISKEEPMDVDTNDDVVSDSNNTTTSEEINSKDMEPSTEADTSDKTAASDEKPPDAALAEEDKNEATLQIEKGKDDENIIDQNIEIAGDGWNLKLGYRFGYGESGEDKNEATLQIEKGKDDENIIDQNIEIAGDDELKKDEHAKDVEKNSENASGKNKDSESSVEVEKDDSKSSSKEDVEDSNVISKESKEKSTEKLPDNNVPHTSTETTENKKGSKKIDDTIIYEKFECKPLIIRADINMEEVQKLKSAPLILGDSIVVKSVASLNKTEEEEKQKKSSEDEHPKKANEIELPRKTKSKAVERSSDRTKTRAKPTKEDVPKKTKEKEVPTTIKEKEKVVEKPEEEDKPKIKCKKMDSIQETKKDTREPSKRLIIKSQSSINESVMTSKSAPTPPPSADAGDIEIMDEKYTKNPMRMYEVCKELKKMSRTQSSLLLAESKKAKKKIALKEQYQLEELTADNIGSLDTSAKSCDCCKKIKVPVYKMDDPAKTLLFCSMYCGIRYKLRKMDTNPVQLRRRCCGFCSRIVNPDEKSLTWKTKNFCEKKCLCREE